MKKFNYSALVNNDYFATSADDQSAIMDAFNKGIELSIDDQNRIWTKSGVYIADVVEDTEEKREIYRHEF